MSILPGQEPYAQQPPTKQESRARNQAEKAHRKAMRPWWKKKRTWLLGIILLIVIISVSQCGKGGDPGASTAVPASTAPEATKAPATKAPAPAAAKIGDRVTAGDWDFTVTKIKCGVKSVGDQYVGKKAQGQFCILNLNVKNNGNEAGTLVASNQKLLDKEGRTFSSDDEASIYADTGQNLFEEINPGNTLKGQIVFDIPKDAKPSQATLAGGLFGVKDSATVNLT